MKSVLNPAYGPAAETVTVGLCELDSYVMYNI